jgi:hypothetical protein
MNASTAARTGRVEARRVARGPVMEYAARAGLTARGFSFAMARWRRV